MAKELRICGIEGVGCSVFSVYLFLFMDNNTKKKSHDCATLYLNFQFSLFKFQLD